jgi:hypothetical protein
LRRAKNRHTALPGPGVSDAEAVQTVKLGLSYLF